MSGSPPPAGDRTPSPAEPPLSPSSRLQQQKLRSKHHFLSPQFDTSCLPEPSADQAAGCSAGQEPPPPAPRLLESGLAHPACARSFSRESVGELNGGRLEHSASNSASVSPHSSHAPLNNMKYR